MSGSRKNKVPRYEIDELAENAKVSRQMAAFNRVKLNQKQLELYEGIKNNTISVVTGQAGTGKTFVSCYAAMEMYRTGMNNINKIFLVKPLETSGEQTGFLPGTLKDKVDPYMQSFMDNFIQMTDSMELKSMLETKNMEFVPAAYVRGRTLRNCVVLIDECQNFDVKQLMTLVTRLGDNCKMIFMGDQRQNDVHKRTLAFNFFRDEILKDVDSVFTFEFERKDIVRNPMLIKITDNYEQLEKDGKLPETKKFN